LHYKLVYKTVLLIIFLFLSTIVPARDADLNYQGNAGLSGDKELVYCHAAIDKENLREIILTGRDNCERDFMVVQDTIIKIIPESGDTIPLQDTIRLRDTLLLSDTIPLQDTIRLRDTLLLSDTIPLQDTLLLQDTILTRTMILSDDAIDIPIDYNATDTIHNDLVNQKAYLVNNATATYGDIFLSAYYMDLNLATGEVFARGRQDSAGNWVDTPVFREGSQEFESRELVYNFKTGQAIIREIRTEQEGGYLHSAITKMHDDGSLHAGGSKYTTCDAEHPHFYVSLNRAKVIPGEKIISGPAYLVLEDIPLPLILPFGFFPVQQKVASGIVMPKYGEERNRGFFLKEGGYYFAISDYFDLRLTGDIYANGSWRSAVATNYKVRYKFGGNFAFTYASNVTGYKGLENYSRNPNYSIRWSHSQDAKARPGSRLSASVNMSSSGFDRENSYTVNEHVTTTKSSSISYSKTWAGTPFNFAASFNHSQNTANKSVTVNLPKMTFSASRLYPLKPKSGGSTKWWQELQLQYTASLDNRINTTDSLLFTNEVWDNMDNGFKHEIPVSIPIRPFNNFTISPQVRYSGVMYTRKVEREWVEEFYDPLTNDTISRVVENQISGLFYGQALNPQISASYSPQIFGTYTFTRPQSRIIAIRHVVKPSVSFSMVPAIEGLSSDMYRSVQTDTLGTMQEYSIFNGNIYGTPSLSNRSGNLSFSLTNIIEAKVRSRNDTTGKGEKVKIIDNLGFNTSYNIFADSLGWSPIRMTMRTRLMKEIDISANGSFDPYAQDSLFRRINRSSWSMNRVPARLTTFNLSLGFDLGRIIDNLTGNTGNRPSSGGSQEEGMGSNDTGIREGIPGREEGTPGASSNDRFDEYGYARFDVPWSLRFSYTFFYSKPRDKSTIQQQFSVNGDLKLTDNLAITYQTGYDLTQKKITMSNIGITRDLHCWDMSFNWVPIGYLQQWNFTIRVKASVLQDLKYERRKDFHDNQN
jgi:lipopolysaccharide assembly outer membrane protein LptD (OstA)